MTGEDSMDDPTRAGRDQSTQDQSSGQDNAPRPVYRKPVLRRYDQIEQVKPYGPSELEAG